MKRKIVPSTKFKKDLKKASEIAISIQTGYLSTEKPTQMN